MVPPPDLFPPPIPMPSASALRMPQGSRSAPLPTPLTFSLYSHEQSPCKTLSCWLLLQVDLKHYAQVSEIHSKGGPVGSVCPTLGIRISIQDYLVLRGEWPQMTLLRYTLTRHCTLCQSYFNHIMQFAHKPGSALGHWDSSFARVHFRLPLQ